jgi:hypothetical protein
MTLGMGLGMPKHRFVGLDSFQGMLDLFPNGSFSASVRKLKANYADNSTVVRIANSDQLGIGFANNELNEPALVTFANGGDAFNVNFKDQTGNGRDFSQASAASQPKIVDSGSVIKANTKPTLSYDGKNYHLRSPAADFVKPTDKLQVSVVLNSSVSNIDNKNIIADYDSGFDQRSWLIRFRSDDNLEIVFGDESDGTFAGAYRGTNPINPENLNSVGFTFDSGTVVLYANGSVISGNEVAGTIPTSLFQSSADITIGCAISSNQPVNLWNGQISEIYLADNLADDIVGIQQNQMAYFNIS